MTGRLNRLLDDFRLTKIKFAELCEVSPSAMQNYLNGKRTPDAKTIVKICKEFSVSADWLLGLSDIRTSSAEVGDADEYKDLSKDAINCIKGKREAYVSEVREALKCRVSQISNPGPRNCEKCCFKCEDEECDDLHIMESALNLIDSLDLFNKKIKDVLQSGCKIVLSLNEIEDKNLGGI